MLIIDPTPPHAACPHCGTRAPGRLFVWTDEGHCCESCHLERRLRPDTGSEADSTQIYAGFVEALTEALDLREKETGMHSRRAACHTQVLARRLISDPLHLRQIYWGSLLHDIGKIGIPDDILLKHGQLDGQEWVVMRTHVELGFHIVAHLPGMELAAEIVRCHEERFDGTGYPRGLKGDEIPLGARLFAVIDTLDAMTSDRSYRQAMHFDTAKDEIVRMAGSQFDPIAVDVFLQEEPALREMVAAKCSLHVPAWPTTT